MVLCGVLWAHTSPDQVLKVSMSLEAHIRGPDGGPWIHPACAMLQPQFPTCNTASSSSGSSAFDVVISPSEDADNKIFGPGSVDFLKETAVMSSEWVELWVWSGVAGWRGSLLFI